MNAQDEAKEAFQNLYGRRPASGRDDEWAAFRNGWNTATMRAVGACQHKANSYLGPAAQSHRRLLKGLSATIVSAKALEKK